MNNVVHYAIKKTEKYNYKRLLKIIIKHLLHSQCTKYILLNVSNSYRELQ